MGPQKQKKNPTLPSLKDSSAVRSSAAEYLTYVAAIGKGGVEVAYANENIWLTQKIHSGLRDRSEEKADHEPGDKYECQQVQIQELRDQLKDVQGGALNRQEDSKHGARE
jgi:hypothetical protein